MNIAILDDYQDVVRHLPCFAVLAGHDVRIYTTAVTDTGALKDLLYDVDALVLIRERTPISAELLRSLPRLRIISQVGRSSHIDLAACEQRGVQVKESYGSLDATAECVWALIMSARRKIPQYASRMREGHWQQTGVANRGNLPLSIGQPLRGTTLGIWGYGRLGKMVANYSKAFSMNVLVWGREGSRQRALDDGFAVATSKEMLFERSDVLTLHLRLNRETEGIVRYEDLLRMKPDALFVNTSRAQLVAPGALIAALDRAHPGEAALDVFEQEPLLRGDTLLERANVLCTPHIGYVETENFRASFTGAFQHLLDYAAHSS